MRTVAVQTGVILCIFVIDLALFLFKYWPIAVLVLLAIRFQPSWVAVFLMWPVQLSWAYHNPTLFKDKH